MDGLSTGTMGFLEGEIAWFTGMEHEERVLIQERSHSFGVKVFTARGALAAGKMPHLARRWAFRPGPLLRE
jgi:hypothetical protein